MPTRKAKGIDDFMTGINGISRQEAADLKVCTVCKKPVTGFKDMLSEREYQISGMCQKCQDTAFAPPTEEEEA